MDRDRLPSARIPERYRHHVPMIHDQPGRGIQRADYSGVPANLTFVPGDTEETISFTATQDTLDDDDESVKLTFGNTLPTGVIREWHNRSHGLHHRRRQSRGRDHLQDFAGHRGGGLCHLHRGAGLGADGLGYGHRDTSPANTDVTEDPASLIFTDQNWNLSQTVTVAVAQDGDAEDDDATVTHSLSGADPTYAAVSVFDVAVSITDDDKSLTCSLQTPATAYLLGMVPQQKSSCPTTWPTGLPASLLP